MLDADRDSFAGYARLADPKIGRMLLAQLATRPDQARMEADVARRIGDLDTARAAFARAEPGTTLQQGAVTPPGLKTQDGMSVAPVLAFDDVLSAAEMAAVHTHACDLKEEFRPAGTGPQQTYRPDARQTLITYDFTLMRDAFLARMAGLLPQIHAAFDMPQFEITHREIKMTNHVSGGFFRTHSDAAEPFGEAVRAITWLYYFSDMPVQYSGGDLYVFDTNFSTKHYSDTWFTRLIPRPNRLVVFPSAFYHAVSPTHLPEGLGFAEGRFAISGHIRKAADGQTWWPE